MSKYSFEVNLTLTKQDIAILQLEDAIDLFLARKWISAVTLAGAAEEIFARLLNLGSKPSAVRGDLGTHRGSKGGDRTAVCGEPNEEGSDPLSGTR